MEAKKKADRVNAAHYSTGAVAASFTSTAMDRSTHQEAGKTISLYDQHTAYFIE